MISPARNERGQVIVLFALMLPIFMGLGAIVIGIGNWYTHAKHLQTKADASALAGGGVWGFPCGADSDGIIETQARNYVGPHTQADGSVYNTTTLNPQVGGVGADDIHAVLNGPDWYDDDSNPLPSEKTDPVPAPGSLSQICDSYTLDVKATESNSFPLFSLLPIYPDIKRKARVEIREVESLSGLLPISVRVPEPVSAAAVFYDEATGNILTDGSGNPAVNYFCKSTVPFLPAGLGGWTTLHATNTLCSSWTRVNVTATTGVAIATSVRPACPVTSSSNCFDVNVGPTVNDLCQQPPGPAEIVQCFFDSDPTGASQNVASGLQFIRGYQAPGAVGDNPPALGSAWLEPGSCNGGYTSGYFAAVTSTCTALLRANFDLGTCLRGPGLCFDDPGGPPGGVETRTATNTEVKYTLVYGTGNNNDICDFGPTCDLSPSWSASVTLPPGNARYSIALRVRLKETFVPGRPNCSNNNFNGQCEWYYTASVRQPTQPTNAFIFANPVQRPFMGNDDRSGPIKFLRLVADVNCDLSVDYTDYEAGSVQLGSPHCFYMDMGLKGSLAKDQDEPPIAFNITGTSQSALVDCDETYSNLRDEIENACQSPPYAVNRFDTTPLCPSTSQWFTTPKAAPFDDWAPFRCVLTQTTASGTPGQLLQGFNLRFFGQATNPSCPTEDTSWTLPDPAPWTEGRNYWHDENNVIDEYTFAQDNPGPRGNRLRDDDPRLVNLFMTAYNSFGGSGNQAFANINFGTFYVTGYGQVTGGGLTIMDPCTDGTGAAVGAGTTPPPDLDTTSNGVYVWGHFINNVVPSPGGTPSDRLCAPAESFMPCIAVLVE